MDRRNCSRFWGADERPSQACRANSKKSFLFRASAVFLLAGAAFAGQATPPKVSRDFKDKDPQALLDVIVQFRESPTEAVQARLKKHGADHKADLTSIKGAVFSIKAKDVGALAQDQDVEYITPDREVRGSLDYAIPAIGADIAAGNGWTGKAVGVVLIDSGINKQPDLMNYARSSSRIVYQKSFITGTPTAADQYGHGTHVAGVLAGNALQSTGTTFTRQFRGSAPEVNIINFRVLNTQGSGNESNVIAAIDEAIKLKAQYNIRVMNISLGRPVFESYTKDPLCRAVERAWQAGIVVVVAAGNEGRNNQAGTSGYGTIASPGNHPLVITVGAMKDKDTETRADDEIASYSSKGPTLIDRVVKPDLVAPGNRLVSLSSSGGSLWKDYSTTVNKIRWTYYQKTTNNDFSSVYYRLSGTSMAAPMVSGAAALMIQKEPSLTPDTVKARLMATASKTFPAFSTATDPVTGQSFTSQYDIFTVGAGYLDAWAALNSTLKVPAGRNAASPVARFDPATKSVLIVNSVNTVWVDSAVWGESAIWGNSAVWGSNVWVNGSSAVWGESAIWGDSAVWGDSTRQGYSAVWGESAVWGSTNKTTAESAGQLINGEK